MIHMMDFEKTAGVEVPAAMDAFALLPFEEFGYSWGQKGIAAHTCGPIGPVPVKGTPASLHFGVTHDGLVLMAEEHHAVRGLETPGAAPAEVFPLDPAFAFGMVTEGRPLPELLMDLMVRFGEDFLGHARSVIIPPSANNWIEGFYDRFLRHAAQFAERRFDSLQMRCEGLFAGFDERLEPRAVLPGVSSYRVLAYVEAQEVKACRVLSCRVQGVAELGFGVFEFKSDGVEPLRHILFGLLDDVQVLMEDDEIIRIADDREGPPDALAAIAVRFGPAVMGF